MRGLWGKFWFRLIVALPCAPVIMAAAMLLTMVVHQFLLGYDDGFVYFSAVGVMVALVAAAVMTVPLWIAMEVLNRRWRQPLPPALAALYVIVFGVVLAGALAASSELLYRILEVSGLFASPMGPVILVFILYVFAVVATSALLSPLILRWKRSLAAGQDVSKMF